MGGNSNASAHNAAQFNYIKASDIWEGGERTPRSINVTRSRWVWTSSADNANAVYSNSGVVFAAANTSAANTSTQIGLTTGDALASFLLGLPNNATRRNVVESEHGGSGLTVPISWISGKPPASLPVNLGLRYDLTLMPIYGNNGLANNFVATWNARHGIYYIERNAPACDLPAVGAPCIPGGVLPGKRFRYTGRTEASITTI